jgi:MFS family permease
MVTGGRPQITNDFNSLTDASWYGAIYLLFGTAFTPSFGKMFQIFNVKFTYLFAMITFLIGSLICGFAPNSPVFIVGRAMSGLGAGGTFSGSLTVIAYTVCLEKRPTFAGILGAVFGVSHREMVALTVDLHVCGSCRRGRTY